MFVCFEKHLMFPKIVSPNPQHYSGVHNWDPNGSRIEMTGSY